MTRNAAVLLKRRWWAITVVAAACVKVVFAGESHKEVVALNLDNFDKELNDPANPLWLLKFYAPWCGHCKHLAPILDNVATKVAGKMAIGKVDCTVQKKLCDRFKISGYPTLKYSLDGEVSDYPGSRSAPDFIRFAKKMSAPAVTSVSSYNAALEKVQSKGSEDEEASGGSSQTQQHEVIFVAYDPKVQSSSIYASRPVVVEEFLRTTDVTIAFEKVARKEQANANFAILSPGSDCCKLFGSSVDEKLDDTAFVARLETNVPPRLWRPPTSTSDYVKSLHTFVSENYFALVNQVGPENFHKLGRHGRPLVLGVVQGNNAAQVETMKQNLLDFCVQGPSDIVSRYYFGWIDGNLWQKFLEQFEVRTAELPQVFVLDVPKKRYWQNATLSQQHDIRTFLEAVRDGKIPSKVSSGSGKPMEKGFWGLVHMLESLFLDNLPWSLLILISTCAAFAILIVPPPEDLRPPYPKHHPHQRSPQVATTTTPAVDADPDIAASEPKKEK